MSSQRPHSSAIAPARIAAFDILLAVERGAHSTDLLYEFSARLSARDAALASELVLGSLRRQKQLDFLIGLFSGRDPAALDPEVRLALRLGVYQLRELDRIPRHAAINESVELTRRAHRRSATGLVNAVLRKVTRDPIPWPDRATALSTPEWLLTRWAEHAETIARRFLAPPETYIRVPAGAEPPAGAEATEIPGCYRAALGQSAGFRIQDISSQTIVPLLGLTASSFLLDLCAAPGGKTAQALESGARVVAGDRSASRLAGIAGMRVALDAARPLPFSAQFDRILVDAPCSGTGTIGRNPEIRWRIQPGDLARHAARQRLILGNALERLAPGGRLVYSTCSLEREENEEVVSAVLASGPQWRVDHFVRRIPGLQPGDGFFAAVITSS